MSKQAVTQLRDAAGVSRANSYSVDPRKITVEENHNYRNYDLKENHDHLLQLKESIRVHGVMQPLWIRLDPATSTIKLVDGECRWRAVMMLIDEGVEIDSVPCIQKSGNEQQRLEMALTANGSKPPSLWEVGQAYKRFLGWGWSEEKIAERMGQNVDFVRKAIKLDEAPQGVKDLLSQAAVTSSAALWAVKTHGDNATLVLKAQVEKAKAKKAAAPAKEGKSKKTGKAPAKPKPVGREKKSNGVFVPFKTLEAFKAIFEEGHIIGPGTDLPVLQEMCETALKTVEKLLPKKEEK